MQKPVMPALKKAQKDDSANKKNLLKNEDGMFGFLKKKTNKEACEDCLTGEEEQREEETLRNRISGRSLEKKKSVLGLSLEKKEEKKGASYGFLQRFAFGKEKKEEKEEVFENPVESAETEGFVSVSLDAVLPEIPVHEEYSKKDSGAGELSFANGIVEESDTPVGEDPVIPEKNMQNEIPQIVSSKTPENVESDAVSSETEEKNKIIREKEREEKTLLPVENSENIVTDTTIDTIEEKGKEESMQPEDNKNNTEENAVPAKEDMTMAEENTEKKTAFILEKEEMEMEKAPKKNSLVSGVLEKMEEEVVPEKEEEEVLSLSEKLKRKGSDQTLQKRKSGSRLLATARFLFVFSFALPLSALIIFQTILSENSGLSRALSAKNYGTELAEIKSEYEKKNQKIITLKKDITQMQQDIDGIRNEKVLTEIADNRIDFLEIMLRINSITLQSLELTPEVNRVINMLVFNSYSASIDKDGNASVNISGSVRDPKRMSFTKLTTLMETINKDVFFSGANIRSFSKSDDNEGGAKSSFTFNLAYDKDPEDGSAVAKK